MDTGVYTKLTDTYGFDLEVSLPALVLGFSTLTELKAYYASLIDCYLNGDGTVDVTATTDNGQIPRCFYSGYVRSGYWYNDGTEMLNLFFTDF